MENLDKYYESIRKASCYPETYAQLMIEHCNGEIQEKTLQNQMYEKSSNKMNFFVGLAGLLVLSASLIFSQGDKKEDYVKENPSAYIQKIEDTQYCQY